MPPAKRNSPASPTGSSLPSKRQRTSESAAAEDNELQLSDSHFQPQEVCFPPTQHFQARCGLQRSIAAIAAHDGFHSATPDAMESFTSMVETYLESVIEATKRLAQASRREHPLPSDFEAVLKRCNLSTSSLEPHLMSPMPRETPVTYQNVMPADADFKPLPLLGAELSGQVDRDARSYIPKSFPDFPSRHTYKFTPQNDSRPRDSKSIREEAALNAQQGEDALRRLVRASKMRKQKEAKLLVERDSQGKERFRLWESTMKRFMGGVRTDSAGQVEIADHSMIVNGDAIFSRGDASRLGKRPMTASGKSA